MNKPETVINYVNAAHFIDHYAMLVFPAALIVMGPALGYGYGELLPYGTPGFIAFGAYASENFREFLIIANWLC